MHGFHWKIAPYEGPLSPWAATRIFLARVDLIDLRYALAMQELPCQGFHTYENTDLPELMQSEKREPHDPHPLRFRRANA
jgi:hypothetical protein